MAENPFGTPEMAAGYAKFRPPVHERILEFVPLDPRPRLAVDAGCGAGISTRALAPVAERCIGLEPSVEMLGWAARTAPGASFVAGAAEAMPFRDGSIDLIAAAGSLNYVDLTLFFHEAARALDPRGRILVYDFGQGRTPGDGWLDEFLCRYPMPPGEARALNPEILASIESGFPVLHAEELLIGIELSADFYLEYMLTEANVAAAVRRGKPLSEIRAWCAETLQPVWQGGPREVLFRAYFCLFGR